MGNAVGGEGGQYGHHSKPHGAHPHPRGGGGCGPGEGSVAGGAPRVTESLCGGPPGPVGEGHSCPGPEGEGPRVRPERPRPGPGGSPGPGPGPEVGDGQGGARGPAPPGFRKTGWGR